MTIAIDFDGTIVEHKYPKIGEPLMFAFETLKELEKQGHKLILWTFRAGDALTEAVDFCKENGVTFYAVNSSYPGEILNENEVSRKIAADLFIDDRNFGGFPGWSAIWEALGNSHQIFEKEPQYNNGLKRFFKKIGF